MSSPALRGGACVERRGGTAIDLFEWDLRRLSLPAHAPGPEPDAGRPAFRLDEDDDD
jgi:hypothetical protein